MYTPASAIPTIGDKTQFNPKLGATWHVRPATVLRLAAFKVLKRTLIANQTVEPTQIAGFSQFYDDWNGTESSVYGAGIDHEFFKNFFGGIEYYKRDLTKVTAISKLEEDWEENSTRAYLYLTLPDNIFFRTEYTYEVFNREFTTYSQNPAELAPIEMKTHTVPAAIGYFHPCGGFGRLKTTFVHQANRLIEQPEEIKTDDFVLVDLAAGYRFPSRLGVISLEIKNLFDQQFDFVDTGRRTSQTAITPLFVPECTYFVRISFVF